MLRFGAKVPGLGHRRPLGDDGLHLRLGVHRRLARRLRDADPRRAARRRVAVHPGRRGRGGLGASSTPIIDAWADDAAAGLPELRGRHVGPGRSRRAARPATAGAGGGSERRPRVTARPFAPGEPGEPVLRWRSRAHSIAEIEQELARIWSQPDLTVDADGDGVSERHIAARTSVMNLVVVARRPEIGERCAATIQTLTGRHPSRTLIVIVGRPGRPVVARRPDPGPLRPAARRRAGDLRRDDLPDVRRRVRPPPRRRSSRRCSSTTCRSRSGGRTSRRSGRSRRDDLLRDVPTGSSSTARSWNGDGLRAAAPAGRRSRTAGRSRSPTSRSSASRAGARRSRRSSTIPDFLPYLRYLRRIAVTYGARDETDAPGRRTSSSRSTTSAWLASRLGMRVVEAARAGGRAGAPGTRAVTRRRAAAERRRGLSATLRDDRDGRRRRRPAGALGDAARDDAAGRAPRERRGSELRADVTAEEETVHVRVWQDGVGGPRARLQRPAPDGRRPPRRGDRGRRPRPGRGRGAARWRPRWPGEPDRPRP